MSHTSKAKKEVLFSKTVPLGGYHISGNGTEKHIVVEDALDYNNMTKSLKKKHQKELVKLVKSTKPPPIRLFHDQVPEKTEKGLIGAVYYEDLEKEEEKLRIDRIARSELTSEELMRDDDYLKIDQSKLPLEIFDNLEFEARDRTPDQWLRSGSGASAPYYRDGAWIWKPIKVLGYDKATNRYRIQYMSGATNNAFGESEDNSNTQYNGIEKLAHRLNIKFDLETESDYHERHEAAETARNEAKNIMRLDHFILQQPNDQIRFDLYLLFDYISQSNSLHGP